MKKVCIIGCGAIGQSLRRPSARVARSRASFAARLTLPRLTKGLPLTGTHNFAVPLKPLPTPIGLRIADLGNRPPRRPRRSKNHFVWWRPFDKGAVLSAQNGVGSEEIIAPLTRRLHHPRHHLHERTRHSDHARASMNLTPPTWMGPRAHGYAILPG